MPTAEKWLLVEARHDGERDGVLRKEEENERGGSDPGVLAMRVGVLTILLSHQFHVIALVGCEICLLFCHKRLQRGTGRERKEDEDTDKEQVHEEKMARGSISKLYT